MTLMEIRRVKLHFSSSWTLNVGWMAGWPRNGTEIFRQKSISSKTRLIEKTFGEIKFSTKTFFDFIFEFSTKKIGAKKNTVLYCTKLNPDSSSFGRLFCLKRNKTVNPKRQVSSVFITFLPSRRVINCNLRGLSGSFGQTFKCDVTH